MNTRNLFAILLMVPFVTGIAIAQPTQPILRLNTEIHTAMISRISTDAQGKYILTCSDDKTAKLWDAGNGELIRTFRPPIGTGNSGMLYACALSPDGNIAAVGGWSYFDERTHDIYLLNTNTGEIIQRITGLEEVIFDLEFSMDGRYLATALGGRNGVRIYEWSDALAMFQFLKKLDGYKDDSFNLRFDHTGRLATVCYDGYLRLYDNNFNELKEIQTSGGKQPYSLAFSPDGSKIAVGYDDSPTIEVYDAVSLELLYKPDISGAENKNGGLDKLSFSADGRYLFGGGAYKLQNNGEWWRQIRRWEDAGKGVFSDYNACQNTVMDIKPMPDNSLIFCGSLPDFGRMKADGTIVFYKAAETNNYRSRDTNLLKINSEGNEISFKPYEKPALYFSVKNKQLTQSPTGFANLKSFTDHLGDITVKDWEDSYAPKLNGKTMNFLEQYERSRSVDISADATSIVFGAGWSIYCLNARGEQKWEVPTQATAWAVNIAGDNRSVVAAMGDGTIRWYRMSDGALLLTLFAHPDNKRWILYTANGYFISSEGGDELIGWHINNGADKAADFYPVKNYFTQFYRPDIVSEVLESCETDLELLKRNGEQRTDISQPPPLVKIISPANNDTISNSQLTVSVNVTDQGGGIDEVLLYLNGKLVESISGVSPVEEKNLKTTKRFNITLTDGENRIKATASNNSRTEAIDEITVTYQGVKATANLYLLIIGVNDYKNPMYRLNCAVADATSFKIAMESGAKDIFGKVETIYMQDATVTRSSVLEKFKELKSKVRQEDVFIFYYSGHGVMSVDNSPQFYIVPFDVVQLVNTNAEMQKTAISASELKEFSIDLNAQKQLFIFDACQAGGMLEMLASRGTTQKRGAIEERAIAQLARSTGTYWLASSGREQSATEFTDLGHGLFTYTILQGLKGEADANNDKKITAEELSVYVKNKLPEFSQKYNGEEQYPNSFCYGMDFPICILK